MKTLIKHFGTVVFSASLASCLAIQAKAATFHASIDNFSLLMPPSITNKFGFTLSKGNEKGYRRGAAVSTGNAKANFKLFDFQQFSQPSGLLDPFSDRQFGRKGTAGSVDGFANPAGKALANTHAVLYGRLGNGTGMPGFPPAEDIPLMFDLSFDYKLEATANLALENASAAYEVTVNGLGNANKQCSPLSLKIFANDVKAGQVNCTFSTILKANEFRDFNIQLKVAGAAEAKEVPPPPPPPPPPIPPDIKIPEPSSTLGFLALAMLGTGSALTRKHHKRS